MREYEILYIIKPHLSEEEYDKTIKGLEGWITKNGGEILLSNPMGIKELATIFEKQTHGYYVQCQFKAGQESLDELNARLRVSEVIFRHLIVTLDSVQTSKTEESAKKAKPRVAKPKTEKVEVEG